MSIFEILMLVSFGAAWPTAIYKSIQTKSTEGKSVIFLVIIMSGYVFGILHKVVYNYDFVIYLYILNFFMVLTDLLLYFYNSKNSPKNMI